MEKVFGKNYLSIEDIIMEDEECILQHDHATIHTARIFTQWLNYENEQILEWPCRSPGLNVIEKLISTGKN